MRLKTVELFLLVGLTTSVGACGSIPQTGGDNTAPVKAPESTTAPDSEGGEGDEGDEGDEKKKDTKENKKDEGGEGGEG